MSLDRALYANSGEGCEQDIRSSCAQLNCNEETNVIHISAHLHVHVSIQLFSQTSHKDDITLQLTLTVASKNLTGTGA